MLCRSAWFCPLLLSWFGRSQSIASLHLYWVWVLLVHPTPKNQSFAKSVHHIYLIACCYSKACFLLYTLSNQKCFMWKIVSKALTNLMAHFIFLLIRSLNHCDYLMMYMPANYELRVSKTMFTWGTLSTPHFVFHFKLISCSFVLGCLPVWNKLEIYESMEFVYVLEKCLGR